MLGSNEPDAPAALATGNTWWTADRARAYGLILTLGLGVAGLVSAVSITGLTRPAGRPEAVDFVAFRSAAVMARRGEAARVYQPAPIETEERAEASIPGPGYYPVMYPPSFLLLLLPLALLPYAFGYVVFMCASLMLLIALLSRILPGATLFQRALPVLAFSGVLNNIESGQNGLLTASGFAAGLVWLDRRPGLAGACLGLLLCKPHLAITIPIVLLAGRRWRALCGFAACGAAMFAASTMAFGPEPWLAFQRAAPMAQRVMEASPDNPARMASIFSALRLLGAGSDIAYAAQAVVAVTVVILCWRAARSASGQAAAALMASSTVLLTPYLFDYDLACVAVPLAWLLRRGTSDGFRLGERWVMLAAFLLPPALRPAAIGAGIPLAPLILCALFIVLIRRIASEARLDRLKGQGLSPPVPQARINGALAPARQGQVLCAPIS